MRDHSATGTENGPTPEDIVTSDGTRPAVQSNAVQTNPAQFNAAPPSDRLPTSVAPSPADGPAPEHYLKTALYRLLQQDAGIFEFLQAGSLDGLWYWDLEHTEHEWLSPRFKVIFGFADHEVPNTSAWWQERIFREDLPIALDNFPRHGDPRRRAAGAAAGRPYRCLGFQAGGRAAKGGGEEISRSLRQLAGHIYVRGR